MNTNYNSLNTKEQVKQTNQQQNKDKHIYHNQTMLGHYLAGLWEGDGHVTIKDKRTKKATLHITMHKEQTPFMKKLLFLLRILCTDRVGSVDIREDNNSCVLNILTPRGLYFVVNLMHGKLRTPKACYLNCVIDWLNARHGSQLKYELINPNLNWATPWFAGFVDADGSFGVDLSLKVRLKIACQFQINQRMYLRTKTCLPFSYERVFNAIASALDVKLHTLIEKKSGRHYYVIKATSRKSKSILRCYFDTFPLLSSKHLDYKAWCQVDDLLQEKQNLKNLKQVQALKDAMNLNRRDFCWRHLSSF